MSESALPKIEDGCVIRSWRCENPNREEQLSDVEQCKRCKLCPVCKMIFCKNHMEDPKHLSDCNFRSNQEREILQEQRDEIMKKEEERQQKEKKELKEKKEFEAKEKVRHENIAKRNKSYMQKG